jgi:hypothetical protein
LIILKEGDHWEDLGVDGRKILRWILGKIGFGYVDWIHLAQDRANSFEHGNDPSGSIKCGEFLDYLSVLLTSREGPCSMELV